MQMHIKTIARPRKGQSRALPFSDQLLPYLLARASHGVSAEFYARLKRRGVPVRRWRLLGLLWDREGLTIGELAKGILIEQSSTTRLVDRAAAEGLVEKYDDPRDRRRVWVRITEAGRSYIADLVDDAARIDRAIAAEIDAALGAQATERIKRELRDLLARFDA
jgi:MarR family transcriptional regulator, organic hydroperoxide resistance regulator